MFKGSFLAVALALLSFSPLQAQTNEELTPHFRFGTAFSQPDGGAQPPGQTEMVRGEGDLALFAPLSVRARPGLPFEFRVFVDNAVGDVTWTLNDEAGLPPGLNFTGDAIVGVPQDVIQRYDGFVLEAVDSQPLDGRTRPFSIDVRPLPAIAMTGFSTVETGQSFALAPSVQDVYGSSEWQVVGTLPVGLGVNPATGLISGIPQQAGVFQDLRLSVIDADGAPGQSNLFSIDVLGSGMAITNIEGFYGVRYQEQTSSEPVVQQLSTGGEPAAGASSTYAPLAGVTIAPGVNGVVGPFSWAVDTSVAGSLALPDGLSLDPLTGVVTGAPSAPGDHGPIRLRATSQSTGQSAVSAPFVIRGRAAVAAAAPAVERRYTGQSQTHFATASNIIGEARWSALGPVPPCVTNLSLTGRYCTSSVMDRTGLRLQVTDTFDGQTAFSAPFPVKVAPVLSIRYAAPPRGLIGVQYDLPAPQTLGLWGSATWTVENLPDGLVANADGSIGGVPTTVESRSVRYTVVDGRDGASASRSVTIAIEEEPFPVEIMAVGDRDGFVAQPFSIVPGASGGSQNLIYSIVNAPSWLTWRAADKAFSGIPDAQGVHEGVRITVKDGDSGESATTPSFRIDIAPEEFTVMPPGMDPNNPGSFSGVVEIYVGEWAFLPTGFSSGGSEPIVATLVSGTLPAGMSLDPMSGVILGTPTQLGSFPDIRINISQGQDKTATTEPLTIKVVRRSLTIAGIEESYRISSGSSWYSGAPVAVDGVGAVTWSLVDGILPSWATFDAATGRISGRPTLSSHLGTTSGLRIRGTDGRGVYGYTAPFSIEVVRADLVLTLSPETHVMRAGTAFEAGFSVSGAVGSLSWSSVATPANVNFVPQLGILGSSSWPVGIHEFVIAVRDAAGASAAKTLVVHARPTLQVAAGDLYQARTGFPFGAIPEGRNLIGSGSWSVIGTLPSWAAVDPATGEIVNVAPIQQVGDFPDLRWRLQDVDGSIALSAPFAIEVGTGMTAAIAPATFRARPDVAFASSAPTATTSKSLTWTAVGGLPSWASVVPSTGRIVGTPADADAGEFQVRLRADTGDGEIATTGLVTVAVVPRPSISLTTSIQARRTADVAVNPSVSNAFGQRTWVLHEGTLPSGLALDVATGRISGNPTEEGVFGGLRLRVFDGDAATGTSAAFSITVGPGVVVQGVPATRTQRSGEAYASAQLALVGTIQPPRWTLTGAPANVSGLFIGSDSRLTGTPASIGTFALTVNGLDPADGANANALGTLVLLRPVDLPTYPAIVWGHLGQALSMSAPALVGFVDPPQWQFLEGTLPSGVNFDVQTGRFVGTPGALGEFPGILLRATDPHDGQSVEVAVEIRILPEMQISDMATLYTARFGFPFAAAAPTTANAAGIVNWTWSPQSGGRPSWLKMDPATGIIFGTPDAVGTTSGLISRVRDEANYTAQSSPFQMVVYNTPSATLPVADTTFRLRVGASLSLQAAHEGVVGSASWSLRVIDGTLPSGIVLDPATGLLSGPLDTPFVARFVLRVTDDFDGSFAETRQVDLTVSPRLEISGFDEEYSVVRDNYFESPVPVVGSLLGNASFAHSARPAGTVFNAVTGVVSGVPTQNGNTLVRITVTDSFDGASAQASFRVAVGTMSIAPFSTVMLRSEAVVQTAAPVALNQDPGAQLEWFIDDRDANYRPLPSGMTLDPQTGVISGTAPAVTERLIVSGIVLGVRDTVTQREATRSFSLLVSPEFSLSGFPDEIEATELLPLLPHRTGTLTGAVGDVSIQRVNLPPGIVLNRTAAGQYAISGSPSRHAYANAPQGDGVYVTTFTFTDGYDGASQTHQVRFVIAPLPATAAKRVPIVTLHGTGLPAEGVSVTAQGHSLTTAMYDMSTVGRSGIALASGQFLRFTFDEDVLANAARVNGATAAYRFRNSSGTMVTASGNVMSSVFEIVPSGTVTAAVIRFDNENQILPSILEADVVQTLDQGYGVGQTVDFPITAQHSVGQVGWSMTGTLPPGLTFTQATGRVSGTFSETGSWSFTVSYADESGVAPIPRRFTVHAVQSAGATYPLGIWLNGAVGGIDDNRLPHLYDDDVASAVAVAPGAYIELVFPTPVKADRIIVFRASTNNTWRLADPDNLSLSLISTQSNTAATGNTFAARTSDRWRIYNMGSTDNVFARVKLGFSATPADLPHLVGGEYGPFPAGEHVIDFAIVRNNVSAPDSVTVLENTTGLTVTEAGRVFGDTPPPGSSMRVAVVDTRGVRSVPKTITVANSAATILPTSIRKNGVGGSENLLPHLYDGDVTTTVRLSQGEFVEVVYPTAVKANRLLIHRSTTNPAYRLMDPNNPAVALFSSQSNNDQAGHVIAERTSHVWRLESTGTAENNITRMQLGFDGFTPVLPHVVGGDYGPFPAGETPVDFIVGRANVRGPSTVFVVENNTGLTVTPEGRIFGDSPMAGRVLRVAIEDERGVRSVPATIRTPADAATILPTAIWLNGVEGGPSENLLSAMYDGDPTSLVAVPANGFVEIVYPVPVKANRILLSKQASLAWRLGDPDNPSLFLTASTTGNTAAAGNAFPERVSHRWRVHNTSSSVSNFTQAKLGFEFFPANLPHLVGSGYAPFGGGQPPVDFVLDRQGVQGQSTVMVLSNTTDLVVTPDGRVTGPIPVRGTSLTAAIVDERAKLSAPAQVSIVGSPNAVLPTAIWKNGVVGAPSDNLLAAMYDADLDSRIRLEANEFIEFVFPVPVQANRLVLRRNQFNSSSLGWFLYDAYNLSTPVNQGIGDSSPGHAFADRVSDRWRLYNGNASSISPIEVLSASLGYMSAPPALPHVVIGQTVAGATAGSTVDYQIQAVVGGVAGPLTFTVVENDSGLAVSSTGRVTGTATGQPFRIVVRVSDSRDVPSVPVEVLSSN